MQIINIARVIIYGICFIKQTQRWLNFRRAANKIQHQQQSDIKSIISQLQSEQNKEDSIRILRNQMVSGVVKSSTINYEMSSATDSFLYDKRKYYKLNMWHYTFWGNSLNKAVKPKIIQKKWATFFYLYDKQADLAVPIQSGMQIKVGKTVKLKTVDVDQKIPHNCGFFRWINALMDSKVIVSVVCAESKLMVNTPVHILGDYIYNQETNQLRCLKANVIGTKQEVLTYLSKQKWVTFLGMACIMFVTADALKNLIQAYLKGRQKKVSNPLLSSKDVVLVKNAKLNLKCSKCNKNKMNTILMPCSHLDYCNECLKTTTNCSICDKVIRNSILIYPS